MRWILSLMLLAMCAGLCFGQYIDPREKATLDFYYDSKTNKIDGSRIITNSLPLAALDDLNFWLRVDGSNVIESNISWGGFSITNLWDGSYTGTAATVALVHSVTNDALTNAVGIGDVTVAITGQTVYVSATIPGSVVETNAFSAWASSTPTFALNVPQIVPFDTERYDVASDFNTTSNAFLTPVKGVYDIASSVNTVTGGRRFGLQIRTNSVEALSSGGNFASLADEATVIGATMLLDSNIWVSIWGYSYYVGSQTIRVGGTNNWFTMARIY